MSAVLKSGRKREKFNPAIGKNGIRILNPRRLVQFGDETEEDQSLKSKERPVAQVARALIVSKWTGKVLLVFNKWDETGDRPPGFGMPGGRVDVDRGETPIEALQDHENGEIPYVILGDPRLLFVHPLDMRSRIEERHVFIVEVDENMPCAITDEEGMEVSHAEWFTFQEALETIPIAATRRDAIRNRNILPREFGIYGSHRILLYLSLDEAGYPVSQYKDSVFVTEASRRLLTR